MNDWLQDAFLWALEQKGKTGRLRTPAEAADAVCSRHRKRRASSKRAPEQPAQLPPTP